MALADARKNFATSTVATAPSPATSGTSLVVASGEGARFPAASFNAVIAPANAIPTPSNSEVVRVTNVATDTFTITRTQESSSARTVIVGDRIYAGMTAADYPAPASVGSITTIQPDDAAAAGTSETLARGDHKHAIVGAAASTLTGANAEGSSTSFARADHDHALPLMVVQGVPHPTVLSGPTSGTSGVANTWYSQIIAVPFPLSITGVRYRVGSAANGNVRSAIYDSVGAGVLASRTSNVAQSTGNTVQSVAFDSPYSAAAGLYVILISFFNSAATWIGARHAFGTATGTNATTVPSAPGVNAVEDADRPILIPY